MSANLPDFSKSGTAFGGTIYRKHDDETGKYVFIFLEPNVKDDRFTLELASSTAVDFPFHLLPGTKDPSGEARYRIRTFLEEKTDGWWNVNISESRLPDLEAIAKTFEPQAIHEGLLRLPDLVDDAFEQLKSALPKFLATIRM